MIGTVHDKITGFDKENLRCSAPANLTPNQEMEKVHEVNIYHHKENTFCMQAANKYILEQYSQTEPELLNELI
jgi:hypothetical protein